MTEEQIENSRRRFEIAGSIVCSMCFGLGLWMMSQPGLGPVKWLSLIPYILMAACCYLSVFWLLDRYVTLPLKSIRLNWVVTSLLGTSLSFIVLPSPIWWMHGSLSVEYLSAMLWMLTFLNIIMFGVMVLVWSIGFIARLIRNEIDEWRVVLD